MGHGTHQRLEELERLVKATLKPVNALRADFATFRAEHRAENAKTQALLRQSGARVGSAAKEHTMINLPTPPPPPA